MPGCASSTVSFAPGGRLSIAEPIHNFRLPQSGPLLWGFDVSPPDILEIAQYVEAFINDSIEHPVTSGTTCFGERDLACWAWAAGFRQLHLDLEADFVSRPVEWADFIGTVDNLTELTRYEIADIATSRESAEELFAHLRPLVERGQGVLSTVIAFLSATKPGRGEPFPPDPSASYTMWASGTDPDSIRSWVRDRDSKCRVRPRLGE